MLIKLTKNKKYVLHDFFLFPGGGEKVAAAIGKDLGAELLTGKFDPAAFLSDYFDGNNPVVLADIVDQYGPALHGPDLHSLDLHSPDLHGPDLHSPALHSTSLYNSALHSPVLPAWLGFSQILQYWWMFSHCPEIDVDCAVFSGSLALLAHKKIHGKKILYCHTPPRLLYDKRKFYMDKYSALQQIGLKIICNLYQAAYSRAIRAMDVIVANSENVQKRLRKYLNVDSIVVYPFAETNSYRWLEDGTYYLSTLFQKGDATLFFEWIVI